MELNVVRFVLSGVFAFFLRELLDLDRFAASFFRDAVRRFLLR